MTTANWINITTIIIQSPTLFAATAWLVKTMRATANPSNKLKTAIINRKGSVVTYARIGLGVMFRTWWVDALLLVSVINLSLIVPMFRFLSTDTSMIDSCIHANERCMRSLEH